MTTANEKYILGLEGSRDYLGEVLKGLVPMLSVLELQPIDEDNWMYVDEVEATIDIQEKEEAGWLFDHLNDITEHNINFDYNNENNHYDRFELFQVLVEEVKAAIEIIKHDGRVNGCYTDPVTVVHTLQSAQSLLERLYNNINYLIEGVTQLEELMRKYRNEDSKNYYFY